MGVKSLWPVLADTGTSCRLSELRGKTLAVDLSGWIVEGELGAQQKIAKPHLKTLFWRISALLQNGVHVLCVADGALCPALKEQELRSRQERRDEARSRQGFTSPSRSSNSQKEVVASSQDANGNTVPSIVRGGNSTAFQRSIDECLELLTVLGVPWIVSEGEAEATCAQLNEAQVVSGVVTNDSDAFLYGANTVYRNMTANNNTQGSSGDRAQKAEVDQIEGYSMEKIEQRLGLDRKKLLAMAALLGCDYCPGVQGVGKEKATTFLKHFNGDAVERLCEWNKDPDKFDQLEKSLPKKKPHCKHCGHLGSLGSHKQSGCAMCDSSKSCLAASKSEPVICSCEWHANPNYRSLEAELRVRQQALKQPDFPPTQVFDIFQHVPHTELPTQVKWNKPDFEKLKEKLCSELYFKKERAEQHILPLITAYTMADWKIEQATTLQPLRIVKKRKKNFQEKYEVEWKAADDCGMSLSLDEKTTLEDVGSFSLLYPDVVEAFLQQQQQQLTPSAGKSRGKKRPGPESVDSTQRKINDMFRSKRSAETTPVSSRKKARVTATVTSSCSQEEEVQPHRATPDSFVTPSKSVAQSLASSQNSQSSVSSASTEDGSGVVTPSADKDTTILNPFMTPAKDDFAPVPSTSTQQRKSRKEQAGSLSRQSSWSSSTSRSHSPRKSTPDNRSRSSSRNSTPSQASSSSSSKKRTPIQSRSFLQTEYARKVIRVEKRTKFRPRIQRDANGRALERNGTTCRKRLFTDSSGIRKRLNFGDGCCDLLSGQIEVDFAPLDNSDDDGGGDGGEERDMAEFSSLVGRRKREPSPIGTTAFYGSPATSRAPSTRASRNSTPVKTPKVAAASCSKAPSEETPADVIVIDDDTPTKRCSPRKSPRKVDQQDQCSAQTSEQATDFTTPENKPSIFPPTPATSKSAKKKPRLELPPTEPSEMPTPRPSSTSSRNKKTAAATSGGLNRKSRRRLLLPDEKTPSVKNFYKPLR